MTIPPRAAALGGIPVTGSYRGSWSNFEVDQR